MDTFYVCIRFESISLSHTHIVYIHTCICTCMYIMYVHAYMFDEHKGFPLCFVFRIQHCNGPTSNIRKPTYIPKYIREGNGLNKS